MKENDTYRQAMKDGRWIDAGLEAMKEANDRPIKDSIINLGQLSQALICIDEAINYCEAQHNSGIDQGATNKLRHIYEWLDCTIDVLENL